MDIDQNRDDEVSHDSPAAIDGTSQENGAGTILYSFLDEKNIIA